MTIRKRNDSDGWRRGAMGIDGNEGSNFTKRGTDPYRSNPRGDYLSPQGAGAYQEKDADFLRRKSADEDPEQGKYTLAGGAVDILDAVEANQSDDGNRRIRSRGQD